MSARRPRSRGDFDGGLSGGSGSGGQPPRHGGSSANRINTASAYAPPQRPIPRRPQQQQQQPGVGMMGVIVDRTSFDSEDRVYANHVAPSNSSTSPGIATKTTMISPPQILPAGGTPNGGYGVLTPAASGAGAAGNVIISSGSNRTMAAPPPQRQHQYQQTVSPPKKLRRRKMNWKPRLPNSGGSGGRSGEDGNASSPASVDGTGVGGRGTNSDRAGTTGVTFAPATDDASVSAWGRSSNNYRAGGRSTTYGAGGSSVASRSTNATPKVTNMHQQQQHQQSKMSIFKKRGKKGSSGGGGGGDDDSTLATNDTPHISDSGGDRANDGFSPYGTRSKYEKYPSPSPSTVAGGGGGGGGGAIVTPVKSKWATSPPSTGGGSVHTVSTVNDTVDDTLDSLNLSGYSHSSSYGGSGGAGGGGGGSGGVMSPGRSPSSRSSSGGWPPRAPMPQRRQQQLGMPPSAIPMGGGGGRDNDNVVSSPSTGTGTAPDGGGDDNLLRLDEGDGISPISRELAMLQAQSEGIITPTRKKSGIAGSGSAQVVTPSGNNTPTDRGNAYTSRSRFAASAGPVDVDSAQFTDAERHLRAIHEMGAEHLLHGEYDEAVEVFTEILRGQLERHGIGHARVGTALHNLGICYLKKGDYSSAIRVCRDAVEVRKGALGTRHLDVAVSLAQLGIAHLESGQHKLALIAFREALHIRRKLLGPKHPKIAKILNNVGCSLFELGEMRGAMLAFEETLDIQRSMMKSPDVIVDDIGDGGSSSAAEQLLLSTAATLCNIGSIKLRLGDADGSIVALEEALLVQQSVLGDNHQIVLGTVDSIAFIESNRGSGSNYSQGTIDYIGTETQGCSAPPMLSRMMNANVMRSVSRSGKTFLQRMEEATLEQMTCGTGEGEIDTAMSF